MNNEINYNYKELQITRNWYASISSAFWFQKTLSRVNHVEVDAFVTPPKDIIGILKSCFTSKVDKYVFDIRNES